jgi:hypothetical protein
VIVLNALKPENPILLAASISTGSTVSIEPFRISAMLTPVIIVNAATAIRMLDIPELPKMM